MKASMIEIPGDLTTPVAAYQRLRPLGARFLLESVEGPQRSARYSFVGLSSMARLWSDSEGTWCEQDESKRNIAPPDVDPLDAILNYASDFRVACRPEVPALLGGLVGYISYDYARRLERLGDPPPGPTVPVLAFDLVGALLIFDHHRHRLHLAFLEGQAERDVLEIADEVMDRLAKPLSDIPSRQTHVRFEPLMSDSDYLDRVSQLQRHIRDGDIFQAVLSREVQVHNAPDLFDVYRALRRINPSPYMFFLDFDHVALAGSSPESAVRFAEGRASLRPIAGTRPRGATDEEDRALEQELLHSRKENAEHAMLVDLARNDLSRVAAPGSVRVSRYAEVQRFSHVMHLVSDVEAKLDENRSAADLIRATFPAGTVSGAPKIRAMQLIDEMETTRRNLYAGCMGYIGADDTLDFALTIRSAMRTGDRVTIRAGAGIIANSTPAGELAECQSKLGALMAAFKEAGSIAEGPRTARQFQEKSVMPVEQPA